MPGRSNGMFLPLLPAPPLPGAGWSVTVIAHTDLYAYARGTNPTPLARFTRFQALSWSPEISDVGMGSVTLRADDPVFSYALPDGRTPDCLWRYDNLWVVYQDGQWRGEFFGEKVEQARWPAAEAAGRTITISGPGAARCLQWAAVLTPFYPKTTPKNVNGVYRFTDVPVMAAWLQLLWAAQRRRTIAYVHCRFSTTRDTGGALWEDTAPPKPKTTATTVVGDVLFQTDSAVLTAAGKTAVAKIAGKLAKVTNPIVTVTGHASSEGSRAHNQQLGYNRANTVANAMLAIRPLANVTTVSKGETQPVASNRTAAGRVKNRRVVVTYQTAVPPTPTVYKPEPGTTLLALLSSLTGGQTIAEYKGPIHCEWIMRKQFELHVLSQIGVDRSRQVVFHEGSTYLPSAELTYDRTEISNVIAVQNDATVYKVATDDASVTMWGRRERYLHLEGTSYSDKVQAQIAATLKQAYAQQAVSTTITVTPGPYRTPFRDFTLGDKIGLVKLQGRAPSVIEAQRVMAISVSVDADGHATYELTLNSTRQARVSWLQTQVDALTNRRPGIRAFVQDDTPAGGATGDLWTPPTRLSADA